MSKKMYFERLGELPECLIGSGEIYLLDLAGRKVQLMWDAYVAYALLPYWRERDKDFLNYLYCGWEISMDFPELSSKKFYLSLKLIELEKELALCH